MNSHSFNEVYGPAGVDIDTLGCVMLDVDLPPLVFEDREPQWYKTTNPKRFWIKGQQTHGHVTLLYGLLKHLYADADAYRKAIDEVLDTVRKPSLVEIESVSFFPSPYDDEDYSCIIGHVRVTDEIIAAHQALSFIPHVDTFPDYKPHVTLGYVRRTDLAYSLDVLRNAYRGLSLEVGDLDYGKMP